MKILLSPAVISVAVAQFGANWLQYTLVTELPTYLGTVLHFNIKDVSYARVRGHLSSAV